MGSSLRDSTRTFWSHFAIGWFEAPLIARYPPSGNAFDAPRLTAVSWSRDDRQAVIYRPILSFAAPLRAS